MANQSIHPKLQKVKYVFSGGRSMEIPSTNRKPEFLCETDIFIHLAWRATDAKTEDFGSRKVKEFNANFGGISILNSLKSTDGNIETKEVAVEEKPEVSEKAEVKEKKPKAKK